MEQKIIVDDDSILRQSGFECLNWWPRVPEKALRNTHTDTAPPAQMQMPNSRRRTFHFDIYPNAHDISTSQQSRTRQMVCTGKMSINYTSRHAQSFTLARSRDRIQGIKLKHTNVMKIIKPCHLVCHTIQAYSLHIATRLLDSLNSCNFPVGHFSDV